MREMLPSKDEIVADRGFVDGFNYGMIYGVVTELHEMGEAYSAIPRGQLIDTSEFRSSYMPPIVGTEEELDALVEYLAFISRGDGVALDENGGER
jgi:hypothetical protein